MTNKEKEILEFLEKEIIGLLDTANPNVCPMLAKKELEEFQMLPPIKKLILLIEQAGNLKVFLKYMWFDLEACRREMNALLAIIDKQNEG